MSKQYDLFTNERSQSFRSEIDRNLVVRDEDLAPTLHARPTATQVDGSETGRHSNE